MRNIFTGPMFAGLAILALACSQPDPTPAPTVPAAPAALSSNHQLFVDKGCAACHGQNAGGSSFAPPLAGHSAAVVKRQIRAPLGIMPVFPPNKISNEEMEAITTFIDGLEGERQHGHSDAPTGPDELALHHWMALFSIEAGDPGEGSHHLGHIVDLTEGEHLAQMKKAIELLEGGVGQRRRVRGLPVRCQGKTSSAGSVSIGDQEGWYRRRHRGEARPARTNLAAPGHPKASEVPKVVPTHLVWRTVSGISGSRMNWLVTSHGAKLILTRTA